MTGWAATLNEAACCSQGGAGGLSVCLGQVQILPLCHCSGLTLGELLASLSPSYRLRLFEAPVRCFIYAWCTVAACRLTDVSSVLSSQW